MKKALVALVALVVFACGCGINSNKLVAKRQDRASA